MYNKKSALKWADFLSFCYKTYHNNQLPLVTPCGFMRWTFLNKPAIQIHLRDGLVTAAGVHFWNDVVFHVIWGWF